MRLVVIALALLAGLKVWTQDRMVRDVMGEAIVEAYRARAEQTCQKQAGTAAPKRAAGPFTADVAVVIGNPNVDVALWDVDSPLWNVRYRHPHLILSSQGEARFNCAYDVVAGLASLSGR